MRVIRTETCAACFHQTELAEERNLVKAHRRQVEKMKIECDKLVEQLSHKEEDNAKLKRKYQMMKQELDDKVKEELLKCSKTLATTGSLF